MTTKQLALAAIVASAAPAAFALSEFDANGDGLVTFEELIAVVPSASEESFNAIDTNGDGTLDADEYAAAQEAGTLPMISDG